MTGLWVREAREEFFHLYTDQRLEVIGHECGHGAFATANLVNNVFGYVIHSALLTPYFAWRSSYRRHHIYANSLAKDHNYVPPRKEEHAATLLFLASTDKLEELTEDSPHHYQ